MGLRSEIMKIGTLNIDDSVILAPMAGVTDFPYRQIIREIGCQLLFTEMVSSKGLVYDDQKTTNLLDFDRGENGLIGVQIFGSETEFMKKAAQIIESEFKPDIIDINLGCPTLKIVKNGAGAALMKDVLQAEKVMQAVFEAVDIPVTVKMRKGWDEKNINADKIARIAEDIGINAVSIHGRTREQFYKGKADRSIIRKVKEKIDIPVIGNGDVFTPQDAETMLEETNCEGVMVARGIQGNPWLIKRANNYLDNGSLLPAPGYEEKIKMALKHLKGAVNYYGEKTGIPRMRKYIAWYLKGLPHSNMIKDKINKTRDFAKVKIILKNYLAKLKKYSEN